jgi:hypothetical protein
VKTEVFKFSVSMAPNEQMESGSNGKISNCDRTKKKSKKRAKRKTDLELAGSSRHGIPSFLEDSADCNYVKTKEDEELEMINKFAAGKPITLSSVLAPIRECQNILAQCYVNMLIESNCPSTGC